ncbi:MAG: hypothetical protein JNG84_00435 [Archangium sp.]|nr:hypothetical protein [Archangium sp.]
MTPTSGGGTVERVHDANTLQRALSRMEPRLAMVIERRFIDLRSAQDFAVLYGLTDGQADRLVWRASRALEAALAGAPAPSPLDDAAEKAAVESLERDLPPAHLADVVAQREAVAAALARARAAYDAAPARTWEGVARWVAIAAVLAWVAFSASRGYTATP